MSDRSSKIGIVRRDFMKGLVAIPLAMAFSGCSSRFSNAKFLHGVASGDPLQDRVVLWTRASPSNQSDTELSIGWEISLDANFTSVVASGVVTTNVDRDFTVKVDASGLEAAQVYFYRFHSYTMVSPIGQTKTLPSGKTAIARLAVVSCANMPLGYFNAYLIFAQVIDMH